MGAVSTYRTDATSIPADAGESDRSRCHTQEPRARRVTSEQCLWPAPYAETNKSGSVRRVRALHELIGYESADLRSAGRGRERFPWVAESWTYIVARCKTPVVRGSGPATFPLAVGTLMTSRFPISLLDPANLRNRSRTAAVSYRSFQGCLSREAAIALSYPSVPVAS